METIIEDRLIEWDDEKNAINKRKHGLGFETAAYVFMDPYHLEKYDDLHSDEEDRYQVIGCVGTVLFVVYTERGDATRIISARLATAEERRAYYDGDSQGLYS